MKTEKALMILMTVLFIGTQVTAGEMTIKATDVFTGSSMMV